MTHIEITGTGIKVEAPRSDTRARRRAQLDRPGQHIWVVTAAWAVADPDRAQLSGASVHLDAENLVMLAGPGCLKCEREYSRKLVGQPCPGAPQ